MIGALAAVCLLLSIHVAPCHSQEPAAMPAVSSPALPQPTTANICTVTFDPPNPIAGQPVRVKAGFDKEYIVAPVMFYRWSLNGTVAQESGSAEFNKPAKRGDKIEVAIFVGPNRDELRSAKASVTVGGSPPVIRKISEKLDAQGGYEAQFEASHPDGAPVTVSLQKGPSGMSFDPVKMEVQWSVPPNVQGVFPVEVLATDPSGGKAVSSYNVTIKQEQQKRSPGDATPAPAKPK